MWDGFYEIYGVWCLLLLFYCNKYLEEFIIKGLEKFFDSIYFFILFPELLFFEEKLHKI